ncbi:MAG: hypothetical protein JNK97_17285, partial [Zoogloea sp.]|nr:hypothetical protein [Zoogloea sp.]
MKSAAPLLCLLVAVSLLAGCASTGPVESRPSPTLPPAVPPAVPPTPGQAPTPQPRPPVSVEPTRPPVQVQPPRPAVASYPDEREGRALVASYLPVPLKDRDGWAADIFAAFAALRLP